MKAPFPWFGGKRRVASEVWGAIGDVDNYVEPFAGSLAVLLERPAWHGDGGAETVNDADAYLSNFWRAIAAAPDEVARWTDWPVNEADLFARHIWLVNKGHDRIARMEADPDYFDAKVAGWWVWGINAWIGSGWCKGNGPWGVVDGVVVKTGNPGGQWRQLPHLGSAGRGVNRQLPHLGSAGQGVNRKLPHLGSAGQGVNRKLPHLGSAGQGVNRKLPHLGGWRGVNGPDDFGGGGSGAPANAWDTSQGIGVQAYFCALAARLRRVRVCCGDWGRVVTDGALACGDAVGVFLDPPYLGDVRCRDLYRVDDHTISHAVREWCLSHGDDPRLRIVLAGYTDEHEDAMPPTWRRHRYSASVAYATRDGTGGTRDNRHKECLWFSPHCISDEGGLFRA